MPKPLPWRIRGAHSRTVKRIPSRPARDHCVQRGVPFFFKQWGGVRKHTTGRVLDGVTWDQFPLCPAIPIPLLADRSELAAQLSLQSD
jgi:protein gp37